jgi:DNA-binding transcriptional regulator YhcF (GntR family)
MLPASLKITINKESSVPVRDQLIEQIGLQIASGTLKGKEKLPSIRQLAQKLGIHHSTVTSAYNHLAEVGLLEIRQGSGVRVASKLSARDSESTDNNNIEALFNSFLSRVTDYGYSRKDVEKVFNSIAKKQPLKRILIVDRNKDFHKLLLAELQPHFSLPITPITYEELKDKQALLADSLITASLYHVHPLKSLPIDPTRFVVCNIEPGRAQLEVLTSVPAGSIVLLVSVSPTLLKMATNVAAALRGEEIAIRTVLADDSKELKYMMKYAKAVLCDSPSEETVKKVCGAVPVHTFQLFAPSTIGLIKDRLEKWG